MQKLKILSAVLGSTLALSGCSFSFPGVYKLDIQQGNVVTQDMIDQLRPGMTQRQVRFIMGNPLIQDTFHPLRWDYLYSIQPGGGARQQERVALYFNQELTLAGLSGDFMPGVSRNEAIMGSGSSTQVDDGSSTAQPAYEERPAPGSLLEEIQREVDEVKATPVPTPEPLEVE